MKDVFWVLLAAALGTAVSTFSVVLGIAAWATTLAYWVAYGILADESTPAHVCRCPVP